ncbi:flagellin [Bacillus sp. JCM 19034]|uniref:flagellin N-terminal helical domain-containing protein n=1 Tax=Bacillus sp. JCM 19034 TaxID=1481928 RepID=UPI0007817696|nr:flagellin [Bacillus sp. JCM 19034]
MLIQSNRMAFMAYRHYQRHSFAMFQSMERLASGKRINRASDDAAGLAISEKMRAQIRGYEQAIRNANDGISLVQTADGALSETQQILQRMRELTVQAANDTNTESERLIIQQELTQLTKQIDHISEHTEFNTRKLLAGDGDEPLKLKLQIGANAGQSVELHFQSMGGQALGLDDADVIDVTSNEKANAFLERLDDAIGKVSSERATYGAYQNRLEHTVSNLSNMAVNMSASESRIRDVDYAREMMHFMRAQILSQVSMAMMVQANQQTSRLVELLR